ncbi:hypothetical protein ACHMW6_17780 [Pseudoduganella sp. UC29_106]|uniref:hypothetical protein n=1 Tax=Pseudoduganella sp. UC29_106 TaxID=3374553 RepID=UPI00375644A5
MTLHAAGMGQAFQQWAVAIAAYSGYRSCLERAQGIIVEIDDLRLHSEVQTYNVDQEDIRLDFCFEDGVRATRMHAECKWTGGDPIQRCRTALAYLAEVATDKAPDRLVIIGSSQQRLDKTSVAAAVQDILPNYLPQWGYQLPTSGTGVWRFGTSDRGALTVVGVVAADAASPACALAVAILLAKPGEAPPELDVENALERLATACLLPGMRRLLELPKSTAAGLDHARALRQLYDPGFVLDPWSYLLEQYVAAIRKRVPAEHCWVHLLAKAVRAKALQQQADERKLPGENQLAARIAPLPLRCGTLQNVHVVRELARAIPHVRRDGRSEATTVRIVCGQAGTGKSTLLKYLYMAQLDSLWRGGAAGHRLGLPIYIDLQRDAEVLEQLPDACDDASCIRALEALAGCSSDNIWAFVGRDSAASALEGSVLAALCARFQISLYVDGYDQLASAHAKKLRALGRWLKSIGCDFAYLLLSSRPRYNVADAFDWEHTFSGDCVPRESDTLSLASPDRADVLAYCQEWLNVLATLIPVLPGQEYMLDKAAFVQWLGQGSAARHATDFDAQAVQANPLLLALALSTYIAGLFERPTDQRLQVQVRADLYEALVGALTQALADHSGNIPEREHDLTVRLRDPVWRQAFEQICFDSLRRSSRTVGRIDPDSLQAAQPDFIDAVRRLPFMLANPAEPRSAAIDFVHPSFHEYFAANYIARMFTADPVSIRVGTSSYGMDTLVNLRREGGMVGTPLGAIIVGLGRDGFMYLLGRLLADTRHERYAGESSALERFFTLLYADFALQQYMYDAGYVDACISELCFAETRLHAHTTAYCCVIKLIGHKYYGSKEELEHGIAYLFDLARQVPGSSALTHWYRLFCIDHIENRLLRIDPARALELVRQRAGNHSSSRRRPQDLEGWCERERVRLMRGLPSFADDAGTGEAAEERELRNVPEPDWDKERLFILRAAHWWGHVGNRNLLLQSRSADQDLQQQRRRARRAYARAIVYRAVSMVQSQGKEQAAALLSLLAIGANFPSWFPAWAAGAGQELRPFERFVGPAQALGDIANQYYCLADVWLWHGLHASELAGRQAALNEANAFSAIADGLWTLARSTPVQGAQGETLLRYFILGAGVKEREQLLQDAMTSRAQVSAATAHERVRKRLDILERQYGMRYDLGAQDVLESTEAFRRALTGLPHFL